MTKAAPSNLSLLRRLLQLLLVPLLVLFALSGIGSYVFALHYANSVYDDWLYDSVNSLALEVKHDASGTRLDLSESAERLFEWDASDKTYFAVVSSRRGLLGGRADFPMPPPRAHALRTAKVFDTQIDNRAVRAVALALPASADGEVVTVEVAESSNKRHTLAREILFGTLLPQALLIVFAGIAVQHLQAGRADRDVGLPGAPGPAHRVGDDDADLDAEPLAQRGDQRRGAAVGIDRQQGEFVRVDVRSVHPGGGLHQPDRVLGDQRATLAGQHPHRLAVDQLAAQRVPQLGIGGCVDDAALALGQHLAGDDDDVVIAQPRRGLGDRRAQIVAGPELRKPGDRQQFHARRRAVVAHSVIPARSSPARTISAVTAGSLISSGAERTVTPSTTASSPECTSQPSRMPVPDRAP